MQRSGWAIEGLIGALLVGGVALGAPWPLKLAVAYLHEGSHAIAALVTGGQVLELTVNLGGDGHTLTQGGWQLAILNAGYLAPMLFGAILVALSSGTTASRVGCLVGALTFAPLALVEDPRIIAPAVATAGLCVWLATRRPPRGARRGCRVLGLLVLVVACLDIIGDYAGDGTTHDTALLTATTGIPEPVWIAGWIATAVVAVYGLSKKDDTDSISDASTR